MGGGGVSIGSPVMRDPKRIPVLGDPNRDPKVM